MNRLLLAVLVTFAFPLFADSYTDEVERWRAETERKLKADDGWLTLTGLFWLKSGANKLGSDPTNDIVLPPSAPPSFGEILLEEGSLYLKLASGLEVTINGHPGASQKLKSDEGGDPDLVQSGSWTFFVIHRGAKWAVRLKDKNSAGRQEFSGLKWYPIDSGYRVTARYTPYNSPKKVVYQTKVNEPEEMVSPGYVTFELNGQTIRMEPVLDENQLWFIFKDKTSPRETYGGGRFLYANLPKEGLVTIDFNRAYNPPCVFTPYATCPLPQPGNRLSIPIRAGEKNYHESEELPAGKH